MTGIDSAGAMAADVVARAAALKPLLAANAPRCDEERRIPPENIDALRDAGIFRVSAPRRLGGLELPFATSLAVAAELGEACGSTAWVSSLVNVCHWLVGLYPDEAQRDVFGADPDVRVCGVLTPSSEVRLVDGGRRVSGRWSYASGCLHAQWALLGVPPIDGPEGRDPGLVLIPMSELTIEDTWFTTGMRGTGSNTLVAEDVFVPEHRILPVPAAIGNEYPTEHTDEALYRSAFVPVLTLILAGPQVGMARGVLQAVIDRAPSRAIAYTQFQRQTDSVAFQLAISDAAMLIDTAALHIARAANDIDAAAARGEKLGYLARARVRGDTGWAIRKAREAIDIVLSANGASSFVETSALARLWRDANTAARHAVVLPSVNQEVYGKALLGIAYEDNITPLI